MAKKPAKRTGAKRSARRSGVKDLPASGKAAKRVKGGHNYLPQSGLIRGSIVSTPSLILPSS